MSQGRRSQAVAGTIVVVFLVAGSRWASYFGVYPFFVTDLLIALAFVHHAASSPPGLDRGMGARSLTTAERLLWLLLCWASLRLAVTYTYEPITVTALRDFAPYLYPAVALLATWSVRSATRGSLEQTRLLLMGALYFHAAWTTLAPVAPLLPGSLFEGRPDIDNALNGILAAILLFRVATGTARRPAGAMLVAAYSLVGVFASDTRAGLLATVTTVGFATVVAMTTTNRRRALGILAAIPALLSAAVMLLPLTSLGQRVQDTFVTDAATTTAGGTTDARLNSWGQLQRWVSSEPERAMVGVGFGPHFMVDSGASALLVGIGEEAELVRSPHNYWLGTFARLGWPGAILVALVTLAAVGATWRGRQAMAGDELRLLVSLLVLGILPIATLGVVLEAPFGAVPFWWALGMTLALSAADKSHGPDSTKPEALDASASFVDSRNHHREG